MEAIVWYSGPRKFLDVEDQHRKQAAVSFLPSVHQAVDLLRTWEDNPPEKQPWTRLRHNRILYIPARGLMDQPASYSIEGFLQGKFSGLCRRLSGGSETASGCDFLCRKAYAAENGYFEFL